jgi:hypothetical protein
VSNLSARVILLNKRVGFDPARALAHPRPGLLKVFARLGWQRGKAIDSNELERRSRGKPQSTFVPEHRAENWQTHFGEAMRFLEISGSHVIRFANVTL